MQLSYIYLHTIKFTEAMKNIIGSLFLLLSVFCLFACSKDNDEELIEEKQYEFSSIMWALQEGDGEEFFEIKIPERIFQNTGDEIMWITVHSHGYIDETSLFHIEDKVLADLSEDDSTIISIPDMTEILSSNFKYLVGGRQAPFQTKESVLTPNRTIEDRTSLAPHCELHYYTTIKIKKIIATYKALLTEKGGTSSYEAEGKWEGQFFAGSTEHYTINEIK